MYLLDKKIYLKFQKNIKKSKFPKSGIQISLKCDQKARKFEFENDEFENDDAFENDELRND